MNEEDLKYFEKKLLEEREALLRELGNFEGMMSTTQRDSSGDISAYAFHMADLGTDAAEREKNFIYATKEGRLLYHIDEALRRIHRNEYGRCHNCGKEISRERLEVLPFARLCIECKEKEESQK